ncbi:Equilibrative nucleotide transporter 3 [Dichanthelium oligosanthes]|uniref:Equilibrative nucleotide transporter 3 n=1 Tax=Dichanthelium oligosanthes TaxID=888268 RepID=A0A1E5W974_9POAL|nr:Equilibrative nucleotide transporter 3 [Dichanthelium oligosanthes]
MDRPMPQDEEGPAPPELLSNKQLLAQNVDYALHVFLIYLLTLSVFPGFLSEDVGSHSLGSWYALVLIASYIAWDLIGRYLPLVGRVKLTSRKGLSVAVLTRLALLPAFYYAGKRGGEGWMIALVSALGLSNGYLTVCVLTEAPRGYKGPEQNALGNLLVSSLLAGIFAGTVLD